MLQRLKNMYRKLDAGASILSGKLKAHDRELAQLRAAVAALAVDGSGDDEQQKEVARRRLEGLLAYQADGKEEIERLASLYESAVARVAGLEKEMADLRLRLQTAPESVTRSEENQA